MFDMDSHLRKYYQQEVTIGTDVRKTLRDARKANEDRLERGLEKAGKPKVLRHVPQGSYSMKTVVQQPENKYDIDNGAAFTIESLRVQGGDMAALSARNMVRDALADAKFKTQPEVKTNCVRVYYDDGYWVDVPVYREISEKNGAKRLEIASATWKAANPEGVTAWFENLVKTKSPDLAKGGDPQFRRVVAYIKGLAKGRTTWKWPSGFIISVLVSETYVSSERDDVSVRKTLEGIHARLKVDTKVMHPVVTGEELTAKEKDEARCVEMRDKLGELLEHLKVLDDSKCTEDDAAKAWDRFYGTTFFKDRITDDGSKNGAATSFAAASVTVPKFQRGDGGRYG